MAINENKLHQLLDRALVDLGGAVHTALMSIGDELGLYKALAKGPQSSAELSRNTQTNERYIREWLNNQAAGSSSVGSVLPMCSSCRWSGASIMK